MAQDTQDRLVAVSYPVDEDYARINSEVLAGQAEIVNTHELDEAGRRAALAKADALLSWTLAREVPPGALDDAGRLGFVQLLSAGVDSVDFTTVPERLMVSSNAGAYAPEMSEHVLAMVLSLAKRTPALVLDGAVCGILGYGGIGVAVARHMRHFGSRIYAITRSGQSDEPADFVGSVGSPADLDHVLAGSDVLVLSLPLTLTTRGLISARELALMKPAAILVNVARGAIVDQRALYEHRRANPDFTAGIDTWWAEPSGDAPFRTEFPFFELPNVLGSPHNSSIVTGTMLTAARLAAQNVVRYLNGEPVHGVVRRSDYVT